MSLTGATPLRIATAGAFEAMTGTAVSGAAVIGREGGGHVITAAAKFDGSPEVRGFAGIEEAGEDGARMTRSGSAPIGVGLRAFDDALRSAMTVQGNVDPAQFRDARSAAALISSLGRDEGLLQVSHGGNHVLVRGNVEELEANPAYAGLTKLFAQANEATVDMVMPSFG